MSLIIPALVSVLSFALLALTRRLGALSRLAVSVGSLAGLSAAMLPVVGSLVSPRFPASDPLLLNAVRLLVAVWWLMLARGTLGVGRIVLGIHHHHPARLASDLVSGGVYLAAALAILDLTFGISVTGLVATSGIIAIVLGLALQSTLGDLFSGIAIGVERPFAVGDLVWIEGASEGRVVETNWRSTRLVTFEDDVATIPNSVVAKSRLLNRSSPSEARRERLKVVLDPMVLPADAIALLWEAVLTSSGIARDSEPVINCTDLRGEGSIYEITFHTTSPEKGAVRTEMLQQIARHLRHAGIALAPGNGAPLVRWAVPKVRQLLAEVQIFRRLPDADLEALEAAALTVRGPTGEMFLRQGSETASLFIVARGALEVVRVGRDGDERRLGTIGPGDYIGELALLTGEPYAVSVRALTAFQVLQVSKAALEPLLRRSPDLLRALEEGASEARSHIDRFIAQEAGPDPIEPNRLIDRVVAYFALSIVRPRQRSEPGVVTSGSDRDE